MKFARAWSGWEHAVSFLHPRKDDTPDSELLSLALLENHYYVHNCWIDEGQIIRDAYRLKGIPIVAVHGRYDMVCTNKESFDLKAVAPQTKILVTDGGHSGSENFAAQKKGIAMLAPTSGTRVTRRHQRKV
jgi:proline iminopeptidase